LDAPVRVLVTGGAGFIGNRIVQRLADRGDEVRILDAVLPSAHGRPPQTDPRAEFWHGDVRDPQTVADALTGVDAVCHQAAVVGMGTDLNDLPLFTSHNDLGTAVLLAAMAREQLTTLVLASSMVVYGEGAYRCPVDGPIVPGLRQQADLQDGRFEPPCPRCGRPLEPGLVAEDAAIMPRSVYAATKVAQENLASAWAAGAGGRVCALRYHNVYGPGMPRDTPYAGVAAIFRSSLAAGRAPQVFEDGGQRRDFVHVDDVAAANLRALDAVTSGAGPVPAGSLRPYNVGSGTIHTIGDMATALAAAAGGPAPDITGQFRAGDVRHVTASSARAQDELGYAPAISFENGMLAFATAPLRER
jgi:dTDP-L-rhamnose 4-epimerase